MNKEKTLFSVLRIVIGFIFLWAFLDKTIGLGFATKYGKAWIDGVSPTFGFLTYAVKGPLADVFHSLAGVAVVDWLFMLGLLFVGLTLLTAKYIKWGCIAGMFMMLLMYLSLLFPENNPIIDEHIVYILIFALIAVHNDKLKHA